MDSSVEIWTAKPVKIAQKQIRTYKAVTKNQKEETPIIRRCRKNCIGDLGAEETKAEEQTETGTKGGVGCGCGKKISWWNCPKKTKSPSMISLTKTASVDCCACCCVLAAYVKEVCRFLLQCPVDSKVSELFGDLMKISGCLCYDCYKILRSLFGILFVIRK